MQEHQVSETKTLTQWPRKEACCWIFADLYDHFGRFDRTAATVEATSELAEPIYEAWMRLHLECQIYPDYIIERPKKEETIEAFLDRISLEIHRDKSCKWHRWESLRSFTSYLRQIYPKDEQGLLKKS